MGHKPFLFSSTGNPSTVTGTTVIDDGRWHHVVFAFTPTNVTIYVDGVTNGTFPLTLAVASANPLGIGFDDGDTPLYFPGSLAEVALYPTALVAQELAAHVQTAMFPFPGGPPPGYSNARAIR
jgi:hypothetical protein